MDFVPEDILRQFPQGSERHTINPKAKVKSVNSISAEKIPRPKNVTWTKTERSSETALESETSLRRIIASEQKSHTNDRNYVVYLSEKLDNIVRKTHIGERSPIENADQLQRFKEVSHMALTGIQNIFREVICQIHPEKYNHRALLLSLSDRYDSISNNLLDVCDNLYSTMISGRKDLCTINVDGLRNKKKLEDCLKCLTDASLSNEKLQSSIKNLNLEIMKAILSAKANEEEMFSVHNLYKLQLQRTESDQRVLAEENCHCFGMALNLIKLFCDRNMVTILDQLQMSKDKWLTVYDRSFLLMRKLITQLFETLAACSEGVMRFSEGLEYIFMSSKYYLDDLLKKIEKLEIYLHPTFEDDIKNRSPEYATRITIQLTDILETAQKLLNKIDELWTVKKCELINQIGLNICQYNRTDENDQKDNDETMKDDENFKQNESINSKIFKRGTFISTLRLNCSSQNVIQPKFYKQLYKILKFEINLYDLKLLLKSASDEFHELYIFMKENLNDQQSSGIFNWLNLTNSINDLEDVLCRLSGILTIQERNLIKLIDLNDLGISTFLHMIEKLKDNLNNEQEEEGPLFDLNKLRKTLTKWKDLMKLEDCDPLQSNSIMDKLSLEGEENSDRNDKNTCLTKYFKNQIDFEIWEQQRNEMNLAKKEFIQALNNLLNEMYQNHSYKHSENVKTEFSKGNNKEEHEVSKSVVNNDLDHLRESNQDGFFCTDSIDYINRQMEAASERQKASFIKRKNLKDAIQQKQELKDKLEKEIEDIDQKLVELRKTLGDAFESMQLEVQHGKL
uniref:Coiled-coil domain-containing protein n=1 Tax=Schistosoma mansoni TaxID=6183 RepID=A0A5K4FFF3_SCHMA